MLKDRKLRPHQVPTPWHSGYGDHIVLIESRVPGSNPVCAIIFLAYMQNRLTNSQRYLVVGLTGLVGLGLPLTVTIRVSSVSAMVSARFSVH